MTDGQLIDRETAPHGLSRRQRGLILAAAFLGWMFAGVEMSLMVAATRPAIQDFAAQGLLGETNVETAADRWFSWYLVAFLVGAGVGGAAFGWLGDRLGRGQAMGWSIICYAGVTGLSFFVASPQQLLVLRFAACLGVGGMWPNGVALVSEAWPGVSRPMLAGLIGTSANVGFFLLGLVMLAQPVTQEAWRWLLLLGGLPVFLGLAVLAIVPESQSWLQQQRSGLPTTSPLAEVFRPPMLRVTIIGILLGTVPLLGGWASGQRLVPWAGQVGERAELPDLKATTQIVWSVGAIIGSLCGGWLASLAGRRSSYFLISLGSLAASGYLFLWLSPLDASFLPAVFLLGLISTLFFGWLPYYLPELFPTRVRATGAGVSFNFGRFLSAGAILSTAALSDLFQGDIAKMGATTSLIYVVGMIIIWLAPVGGQLQDATPK